MLDEGRDLLPGVILWLFLDCWYFVLSIAVLDLPAQSPLVHPLLPPGGPGRGPGAHIPRRPLRGDSPEHQAGG